MRARWVTIGVTLACFVAAALASPFVARQFFPPSDRPDLLVDLSLPQNASIYASEEAAEKLDGLLKGDPDVDRWSTYVGRGAIRFYLPLNVELANDFFTQAVVLAKDVAARERLQKKLEAALAENFPNAVSRVSPLGLGPPVGWPVQYRVSGPDLSEVRDIGLQLAQIVATDPGSRHINFDWMEPARMVRINIDQDQARLLGLSRRSSVSRFRPIMLTAVSTVLGLIPIAVTIFWGPMAIAVMGGLLVATVLTLIFLPALYVAWFRVKEPAVIGRKVMPSPTATDAA
jgi:multidrug efflux pump subunit AcrB